MYTMGHSIMHLKNISKLHGNSSTFAKARALTNRREKDIQTHRKHVHFLTMLKLLKIGIDEILYIFRKKKQKYITMNFLPYFTF